MSYHAGEYEIIVVGAGHAGCEAALAAARMGKKTLLLTISIEAVALMPCNPSIGGPAKSHLVREIDALGGEMAKNTDKATIQARMLNTSKGPAVRALRVQTDKHRYQVEMLKTLQNEANLHLREALVEELVVEDGAVKGVLTEVGAYYRADAVILATGTYLASEIIIGEHRVSGGPSGQRPAVKLAQSLKEQGLKTVRFSTGSPARVAARSLDYGKMKIQLGDRGLRYSFYGSGEQLDDVPCWLTYTNEKTHEIIRDNLARAPLVFGIEEGGGPRYCPSIEDKVVRFADKLSHQIFIEPEGLETTEMYVQGLSTSLPEEVQVELYRTLSGLERAEFVRSAYSIEYEALVSTQLLPSLELKGIKGLFSAGQINGTSGYEEAAAQGVLAGINAVLLLKGEEPFVVKRSEGYLGVLVDDLVTKGTNEPYRLLTARAEYRLLLRQDNADLRLSEKGYGLGLLSPEDYKIFTAKKEKIESEIKRLSESIASISDERLLRLLEMSSGSQPKKRTTLAELLKRPEIKYADLLLVGLGDERLTREEVEQVEIQLKYEGYITKQIEQVRRFEKMENKPLPGGLDYAAIKGLKAEAQEKLEKIQPASLGQAGRISGVSPADIAVLMIYLEQERRGRQK